MRRLTIILAAVVSLTSVALAQIQSVRFNGGAIWGTSLPATFSRVSGYDAQVEAIFGGEGSVYITLGVGYEYVTIDQDSALERWNWRFWNERYRGSVSSTIHSGDSANITARFDPLQTMNVYPVTLGVGTHLLPMDRLSMDVQVGVGMLFYQRKLSLDEQWSRYFSAADYTFSYSFLNFADPKLGHPLSANLSVDAAYRVSELLNIRGRMRYMYVVPTEGKMGYDEFPIRQAVSATVALEFLY